MNPSELRSTLALAGIFGLRMLGLFLLLPVFSVYARGLPGGEHALWVGLTLGIFNIVQACLYIPLGRLSDRIGRKPVVFWGLSLFVAGALICAARDDLIWIAIGRGVMGAGAISAAISAWVADLTREQVRTRAMALVGGSIALSFALSLVIAAPIYRMIGMGGIFIILAILGVLAMGVTYFVLPNNKPELKAAQASLKEVFLRPELMRLNAGVFVLHATQVAMFLVVPRLLVQAGLPLSSHWEIYLPVVLLSFCLMAPVLIMGEKKQKLRNVLLIAIILLFIAECAFTQAGSVMAIAVGLLIYFVGFNLLEALQPSLVSRFAKESKGTALGVYNTTQSIGLFSGAVIGGWLMDSHGQLSVFVMGAVLLLCWLIIAWSMQDLPAKVVDASAAKA
ncbi:MFS transporter [Polynucleobacter sphagniphilus]|jgi:predicted MFS family arabinose efflux permease|uniref:MFS family arabinose efflux permease n=1 Tax=Polynucleobacter sphagniphilus TaxID=1743169 RepID=A0AA43M872_9BURK|nr:MFS transporter [Polynucleobacter sphagniphilus]MDH6155170.1 putative MFS family arabinose efflux permease [Polynucleobacter sphagniphilus]MDH6241758.1 putative MFS family arabinose efflux permease [Polynucleobacter sphagniphilus]MDH6248809.1 putative MFS family arabinose efflux permease [Polynucleobacter sphagniphilus]MDH6299682.1 putative MFS family arabinose efflux permease [Polynucleobacter sphagniphilus]MDH6502874.1 putative MFS family arabinose efflux permease [Polynucleobacter sphagn